MSRPPYAFSICTAQTLYSGILETGSRAALVSLLAEASAKWNGRKTVPGTALGEIWALTVMSPRRVRTRTWSPEAIPYLAASACGQLQQAFRGLFRQTGGPPAHGAGMVLVQEAAGGEIERVFGVGHLGRVLMVDGEEGALALGETVLVEVDGAGVFLVGAGPLQAAGFQTLVGNPGVSRGHPANLLKDRLGVGVVHGEAQAVADLAEIFQSGLDFAHRGEWPGGPGKPGVRCWRRCRLFRRS